MSRLGFHVHLGDSGILKRYSGLGCSRFVKSGSMRRTESGHRLVAWLLCCRTDALEGDVIKVVPSTRGIPYCRSLLVPLPGGRRPESNAGELNRKVS